MSRYAIASPCESDVSLSLSLQCEQDTLLNYVHNLSQRWLVDKTCLHIYNRAMLHDALTAHVVSDGSIGPSQVRHVRYFSACVITRLNYPLLLGSFSSGLLSDRSRRASWCLRRATSTMVCICFIWAKST